MMYLSPNVRLIIHSLPSLRICLGAEDGSPSSVGSEFTGDENLESRSTRTTITPDAKGVESWEEGLGRGRKSSSDGDGHCGGINGLRSFWAKVSLAVRPGSRYSAPGMFWNYATLIFGPSGRGWKGKWVCHNYFWDQATARWHFFFDSWTLGVYGGACVDVELYRLYGL